MEAELIIQADQVAAISRDPEGKYHVHTTHGGGSTAGGAIWGGFWGLLFGMLFFIPFAGWAMGAGLGALFGHMSEKGIDKAFQPQARDYLKPGTSALSMVIEKATPDKAIAALEQYGGTVIRTSLSNLRRTQRSSKTRYSRRPRRVPLHKTRGISIRNCRRRHCRQLPHHESDSDRDSAGSRRRSA